MSSRRAPPDDALTRPPSGGTFLNLESVGRIEAMRASFGILGIPYGVAYTMDDIGAGATKAPSAVRARSARYASMRRHYDFDTSGEMLPEDLVAVDCGDVLALPEDAQGNRRRATQAVRAILDQGATPIILGGNDSIPALALNAYDRLGPITVLQIDAHIDFRDEVRGVRDGYSSPMRRASEMPWVEKIVHVGTRGVGSARPSDVNDTQAAGNVIVTAQELGEGGIGRVLDAFPASGNYFITVDSDGFDPAVMPGTSAPLPGGLTFQQGLGLVLGLAGRGRVVGMDCVEYYPDLDVNGITALGLVRLIVSLMAAQHAAANRSG